jgi:hypothetical protein
MTQLNEYKSISGVISYTEEEWWLSDYCRFQGCCYGDIKERLLRNVFLNRSGIVVIQVKE